MAREVRLTGAGAVGSSISQISITKANIVIVRTPLKSPEIFALDTYSFQAMIWNRRVPAAQMVRPS